MTTIKLISNSLWKPLICSIFRTRRIITYEINQALGKTRKKIFLGEIKNIFKIKIYSKFHKYQMEAEDDMKGNPVGWLGESIGWIGNV